MRPLSNHASGFNLAADSDAPALARFLPRVDHESIVGRRQNLEESLQFAAAHKVAPRLSWGSLENINEIFRPMVAGKIDGCVLMRPQ